MRKNVVVAAPRGFFNNLFKRLDDNNRGEAQPQVYTHTHTEQLKKGVGKETAGEQEGPVLGRSGKIYRENGRLGGNK